jgi:hypothetical protein
MWKPLEEQLPAAQTARVMKIEEKMLNATAGKLK